MTKSPFDAELDQRKDGAALEHAVTYGAELDVAVRSLVVDPNPARVGRIGAEQGFELTGVAEATIDDGQVAFFD